MTYELSQKDCVAVSVIHNSQYISLILILIIAYFRAYVEVVIQRRVRKTISKWKVLVEF